VGSRLEWIDAAARFTFWKDELAPHLAEPGGGPLYLEQFPGEYFYGAGEWRLDDGTAIVVVEKHH
jgi:hypothetical protein